MIITPTDSSSRAETGSSELVGLTQSEATERLLRDGPNRLPVPPAPAAWRRFAAQLVHFFALLLWAAAVMAVIAGMPELGVAIAAIVVLNGAFAFVQEYRAEHAAERLRDLLPRRMTVFRDSEPRTIDATELVVDDAVLLAAGDRISADMQLIENHQLGIDTSTLTGESVLNAPEVNDRLYAGTFVVEGEGVARVVATGARTRLAGLARLTRAGHRPRSPLSRELDRVVRVVAAMALGVGVIFFVVGLLLGLPPVAGFLFAIGVSVALVPEGLLPTVTLSLAVGAQRMARRHALVRRLEAVETLGATTFICTDKTGTLTHNQMEVLEVWTPTGSASISGEGYEPNAEIEATPEARPALHELALVAGRCSRGRAVQRDGAWVPEGDPMEAALDVLARRLGIDVAADELRTPVTRRFPFDPRRRRMSLVADGRLLMKGAPEVVLPLCRNQDGAMDAADQMAHRGLRVLAVAARRVSDSSAASDTMEELERDLDMLGLVGLEDPPRANAAAALAACRGAGIRVAMITGDHPGTAAAIARQVGLLCETSRVIDGRDLPSNDCDLAALLDADGTIVSRVAPEDKLRIARALRTRGHVVAMTGDGVNDGPALHEADIGVAMGRSGTDVAREAADLVLLDDDFSTIVAAIEQGRATFGNLRRCLTYHLTDNVAELTPFVVWALSGGTIPLALGVLQILFLDVGTDQLPALGLGIEPPGPHVLQQPPSGRHLLDAPLLRRVFGLLGPTEALVEMVAFGAVLLMGGWRLGETPSPELLAAASGAAFATVVFGQAANAMACRSASRWPGSLGWTRNRFLVASIGVEFLLLLGFLFIPTIAHLLGQAPPPAQGWLIAALAVPAVLLVDAAHKRLRGPRTGQTHSHPRG